MRRQGGAGTVAAAVLIVILVAVAGLYLLNGLGMKSSVNGGLSDLTKGVNDIQNQESQVQIGGISLISGTFDGTQPLSPTCGTASANSYIALTNTGSSGGQVSSVTITYGGASNLFVVAGPCTIGPSGSPTSSIYVLFPGPSALPNSSAPQASEPFQGTVNLQNGVKLPFSGDFQEGYPRVFVTEVSLVASQLSEGQAKASCHYSTPTGSSFLELTNNGTESISATQLTLAWNGTSVTVPIAGPCELGQGGSQDANVFVLLGGVGAISPEPEQGESYTLSAFLPNGAAAPLTVETNGSFE